MSCEKNENTFSAIKMNGGNTNDVDEDQQSWSQTVFLRARNALSEVKFSFTILYTVQ